jgi:hypothetical protein
MLCPWVLPRSAAVGRLGPADALAAALALGELPPALGAAALGAVVAVPPLLHAANVNAAAPASARILLLSMRFLLLHWGVAVGDG